MSAAFYRDTAEEGNDMTEMTERWRLTGCCHGVAASAGSHGVAVSAATSAGCHGAARRVVWFSS